MLQPLAIWRVGVRDWNRTRENIYVFARKKTSQEKYPIIFQFKFFPFECVCAVRAACSSGVDCGRGGPNNRPTHNHFECNIFSTKHFLFISFTTKIVQMPPKMENVFIHVRIVRMIFVWGSKKNRSERNICSQKAPTQTIRCMMFRSSFNSFVEKNQFQMNRERKNIFFPHRFRFI